MRAVGAVRYTRGAAAGRRWLAFCGSRTPLAVVFSEAITARIILTVVAALTLLGAL